MKMRGKEHCLGLLLVMLLLVGEPIDAHAGEARAPSLPPDGQLDAGLCIVAPAPDGAALCDLTRGGRVLVQALAADDASLAQTRQVIQSKGLYGVATIARPLGFDPLPYADDLVNLVIIDRDALGPTAPAQAEILRIVAPQGTAWIRQDGQWRKIVKPRPADLDDWTHFDYDAAGGGVSHDKRVRPPSNVQWRLELQEYWGLGGNPAGYRPYTGFRLVGGKAFFLYNSGKGGPKVDRNAPTYAVGRDAFNGLPIWKSPAVSTGSGTPQENQFVASAEQVFTFAEEGGFPIALDARTGQLVRTFDKAGKLPGPRDKTPSGYTMLRCGGGVLIESNLDRLYALDAATGNLKWSWQEKDGYVCFPRLLVKERRVLAQVVESDVMKIQGRWGNLRTSAILCLDLDSGKALWRSTELKDTKLGQLVPSGDRIFAFCPAGIGANENSKEPIGLVACLDAATGKLLWKGPQGFPWGYNLLSRDGQAFYATPSDLNRVDGQTGAENVFWKAPFNNRCNRTAATDDWIIMGLGVYVDRQGAATVRGVARSGCAQGAFPANGLVYFTPNTCTCITQLRGHLALSPEPIRAAVDDARRLAKTGGMPTANASAIATDLKTPIAAEWPVQIAQGALETPAVMDGQRSYVAVIHEHRLECRQGTKLVWAFTAGGRISQPPVLHQGLCLFGSHDGYVYCLDAADGSLRWRFLAAPYERNIVSHGQIESSWPVFNVVMHDGKVCFTAGLHPEVGGGIHAWGLEPGNGAVAWHKVFKRTEVVGKAGLRIAPNRVINSPLQSDGKQLAIVGLSFSPGEPDADIQQRIDQGSAGDKNRNLGWTIRGTEVKSK